MNNRRNKKIFFSNLIMKNYILKNDETEEIKDVLQPYYDVHKKKFNEFTVCVIWK